MTRLRSSGSTLTLLLCLLLLVPRMGLAAGEVPSSSTTGDSSPGAVLTPAPSGLPGTSEPLPLRLNEDFQASRSTRSRARGLRILAETGAGLLTGTGLAVAGVLGGRELCRLGLVDDRTGWFACVGASLVGGLVGAGLGVSLGVFWGGEVTGGDGKLYGAFLGMASGLVTGILLTLILGTPSPYALAVPLVLGSVVGYELTTRAPTETFSRPSLRPVLAVSSHGALLGLGGCF
jgi:hypothetical protein